MKLKIGTKLIGGFFIVSLLVAIAGGLGISAMKRISTAADKVINEEVPIIKETLNLKAYSVVARDAMAEYLLKGTDELEDLNEINTEFSNTIKAIEIRAQAFISGNEVLNVQALASDSEIALISKELPAIINKLNDSAYDLMNTHRESLELKPQSGAKMEEMDILADELIQNARARDFSVETITSLWEQVMAVNDFLITGDNEEINAFEKAHDIVSSDPKYHTVKALHSKVTQLGEETIELFKKYHEKVNITYTLMHDVDEISEKLMSMADQISQEAIASMNQSILSAQRVKNASQNLLIVITTIAFISAITIGFFLTKGITRPIALCVEFAQRIASGDLSKKVEIYTKDETCDLGDALNGMLGSLRNAIDDINQKVDYLNKVPTPVVVVDRNYEVIFMNEAGAKTIGRTVETCLGQKCYNLFDTPHCNTPECRCSQAMEKGGIFTGETIARGAGNIPIQYTAAPLKDKEGKIVGALEYVTDFTQVRKAMDDAQEKVEYLNNVPTPIVVVDKDYKIAFINEAGAKTLGKTLEACVGQKCYNLFDTPHCNTPKCRCRQSMEKGGIFTGETVARGAGNIPIQYTAAPLKDKEGKIVGALEYVTDFTQVRRAMDDAQEKVDYLNNVPAPVVVIDKEFKITFINEAGAKTIGKTVDACVGQKCYNLFDTPHCNTNECRCRQAMEKDGVFMGETIARGAGNIFIQYTAAPMKDKEGKIVGALEYVTNISAIKEQQKYLEENAKAISEVMAKFANGDLTINLEKEQEDEIGLIIDNINLAVTKIREMVILIRDAAGNVASTREEISAATEQITKGAQSQASATDETGSTMEEMSVQIQNVAKNAEGLAGNVDETTSSIQQMMKQINFPPRPVQRPPVAQELS
jgi:PAS domain S-box-containing protein